jgi:hypothetical protein
MHVIPALRHRCTITHVIRALWRQGALALPSFIFTPLWLAGPMAHWGTRELAPMVLAVVAPPRRHAMETACNVGPHHHVIGWATPRVDVEMLIRRRTLAVIFGVPRSEPSSSTWIKKSWPPGLSLRVPINGAWQPRKALIERKCPV